VNLDAWLLFGVAIAAAYVVMFAVIVYLVVRLLLMWKKAPAGKMERLERFIDHPPLYWRSTREEDR
jgi:hypothetical protein